MRFAQLLEILGDRPVFSSALLRAGDVDPVDVASQLSRWVASGKLSALRRGVYAVAEPYRRRSPHSFEAANLVVQPSYVSLESALAFHGLIPEAVFATTSVTTARPSEYETDLGYFSYRHVAPGFFWGYSQVRLGPGAGAPAAFVARPEKALLDLAYLRPRADSLAFLRQMRLQRLETLDLDALRASAERSGKPKLERVARLVADLAAAGYGEAARR